MQTRPPPVTRWLLGKLLPADAREFVLGDLDEEFRRHRANQSGAAWWYRSQAFRSAWRLRFQSPLRGPTEPSQSGGNVVSHIQQDVRFALRTLRRTPGFTALVLLTLALGVGATTAIFSAVNEVALRPLPFAEPDRLVMLWESNAERGWDRVHAAPANVMDWRARVSAFEDVALLNEYASGVALAGTGNPREVLVSQVSGNTFSVLGAPPALGRTFTFEETWADTEPVIVLSHDAWQRHFGGEQDIVGRTIRLDGVSHEVIGVMGPDFHYKVNDAELWTTFRWSEARRNHVWFRQAHVVRAVARLRDGVTIDQARGELESVAATLQEEHPQLNRGMEAGLTPLHPFLVGDRRLPLMLLLGSVLVLQLIACANVANLLLVRSVSRRQELAVRTALGAGRTRVIGQVLTESFVIATIGSLLGAGVGVVGLRWIASLSPPELPDLVFRLDWRLLLFTAGITGLSAVLFGLYPALRGADLKASEVLTDGSRTGSAGRRSLRAAHGMVAAELALAVMLVAGAGLMLRNLQHLQQVDPGVDVSNVLTFQITPPRGSYPTDRERADFAIDLAQRLEALPGVFRAGAVRKLPYTGWGWSSDFSIEGWSPDEFGIEARHRQATADYFKTMSIPLTAGRMFRDRLGPDEAVPVVVNQAFADRYFPDDTPVGKRVAFDRHPDENSYWYPIVAVVGNERLSIVEEPRPEIISHLRGDTPQTLHFALKTTIPPLSVAPLVRATLHQMDPEIPLVAVRTMERVASDALAEDRFLLTLLGVFAGSALLLAAIGVYGVAAQAARGRVREIGIRMALGATDSGIVRLLVLRGAAFIAMGLVLGLVGSLTAGRLMQGLLFGVKPGDPVTLGSVGVLLALVALGSSYLPARRATRLDPARVLRGEGG